MRVEIAGNTPIKQTLKSLDSLHRAHKPAFLSARGRGVLVVWGGSYCDGILPREIFQKKRLKELKARGIAKIIKVEKKPHAQSKSLAKKLNHLRVPNGFPEAQNLLGAG